MTAPVRKSTARSRAAAELLARVVERIEREKTERQEKSA